MLRRRKRTEVARIFLEVCGFDRSRVLASSVAVADVAFGPLDMLHESFHDIRVVGGYVDAFSNVCIQIIEGNIAVFGAIFWRDVPCPIV